MDMQTCIAGSTPALSPVFIAQRLERLTVVQEVGVQFPLNTNFFLIVCGCWGVVKRSISKCLFAMVAHVICNHVSAVRFRQEAHINFNQYGITEFAD